MEEQIKDSEKYYNSFIQELEDYNDLFKIEFYYKYIDSKWEEDCIKEWNETDVEMQNIRYPEWYEEFKQEWINDNLDDYKLNDLIKEYFEPLDIETYTNDNDSDDKIYVIQLTWWWPNVDITINTKWWTWEYEFNWWWDQLKRTVDSYICWLYLSILLLD